MFGMLDQLKVAKAAVVGHDWGAALAWSMALTVPDRVAKLCVLSVGFPGGIFAADPRQRELSWYILFFQLPQAEECLMADNWALFRELTGKNANPQQVDEYVKRMSDPGALTAGLGWYRANFNAAWIAQTKPQPVLTKLPMPVMGVYSTKDAALTEAGMIQSEAVVESGKWQYERLEGIGHWMTLEAPDEVNRLLLDFLA
eukprot:GHRR01002645.1.p1 GENE.GHRR01002645.1~~GHRR01002645.1.p1  ORF type:complete len:200 (+),score=71.56 GHRR01002645.1:359-958(+)